MIIKEYFYAIECDNCKEIAQGYEDVDFWTSDESGTEENATESEWHKEDDKHYCPDCHSFDDEDNLVINRNSATANK